MFSKQDRQTLKTLAKQSIEYGLQHGCPIPIDLTGLANTLKPHRATFVTLEKNGKLRGCIGMLEAVHPLAMDVAANSYAAAFTDSRFKPVNKTEIDELDIHLSILSPTELIICLSEEELIKQLRPKIDGLVLEDGYHRATFLPSVWDSLTEPVNFVKQLKLKAGLSADYWSEGLYAYRYTSESF